MGAIFFFTRPVGLYIVRFCFKKWYKEQEYVFKHEANPSVEPSAVKDTASKQAEVISAAGKKIVAAR